jgi:zinc transport system ATP-binding protein
MIRQGDFLALIGPNGGGKTTLLHLLLGLLTPQEGRVAVFNEPPAAMSRHIGYVPQFSTMQLDFPASVLEMVLMGSACPGIRSGSWDTSATARDKARGYLELLGLSGLEKQRVGALSGGQRQRALVARALMGSPCNLGASPSSGAAPVPFLLLLDEPTASIDPEGKFCFYEFLDRLRGTISIIVVSHDFFMASPFFSSIAFVNTSLTSLENRDLSPENLDLLFGRHQHDCPVAYMRHAGRSPHLSAAPRGRKEGVIPSASGNKR